MALTELSASGPSLTQSMAFPSDILFHIFTWTNISDTYDEDHPLLRPSHVCSFWRQVILQNPLLWTDLRIFPPFNVNLVETLLRRSLPCSVMIDLHLSQYGKEDCPIINPVIDLIVDHFHRCRRIYIKAYNDTHALLRTWDKLSKVKAPVLESFMVDCKYPGIREFRTIFDGGAPALRRASIDVCVLPSSLQNLTSLQLTLFNPLIFKRVISQCHVLSHLTICYDFWDLEDSEQIQSPSLLSLTSLHVLHPGSSRYSQQPGISYWFSAPNLRELAIVPICWKSLKDYSDGFPFVKSLILGFHGFRKDAWDCIHFPHVVEFTAFGSRCEIEHVFRHLAKPTIGGGIQWPFLRSVMTGGAPGTANLIQFREIHGCPLKKVITDLDGAGELVMALEATGLNVQGPEIVEREYYSIWEELRRAVGWDHEGTLCCYLDLWDIMH